MITQQTIRELADHLKIDQFTVWREYLQLVFLKYFYAERESSEVFFKGGTAIHFLLGSGRFSEDLDFSVSSSLDKAKLRVLMASTLKNMNKEVPNVALTEERTMGNSFSNRIKLSLDQFKFPLTVRLDFSLREKPLEPDSSPFVTIFPVGPHPVIAHLSKAELAAEKIRALMIRGQGRDVYDLWFLLSKEIIPNWTLVNRKMAFYKRSITFNDIIDRVLKLKDKDIKQDLVRFLPETQRAAVLKIKEELLEKLEKLRY